MPKKGEKQRKIDKLKSGENVKPPKKWWDKLFKKMKKQYPNRNIESLRVIVGGIWNKYSTATKIKIIKEYQI